MSPEDIRKLLGGYATGTLTEAERQALFAAALEDQELFDALVREQPLHDLLSDPAARAELLSALDTPASRWSGFWQWLRRPVAVGLATAAVTAIALVVVWRGTRVAPVQSVIVAELRSQPAPPPTQPPAEIPAPARRQESKIPPPARMAATDAVREAAPPVSGMPAQVLRKDEAEVAVRTMKAEQLALQDSMKRAKEAESSTAGLAAGAKQESVAVDARSLFYANQSSAGANAFVQQQGGAGGVLPPAAPQADAAPRIAKSVAGLVSPMAPAAPRLGVRVSILRGDREVDLTTVLDPGEAVRLKVTPNADGFLYVFEGTRLVTNAAAQRLKPFETPELRVEGSGQKQFYVMLSRRPQNVDPASVGALARGDLLETSASQDRATYVVNGPRDAAAQQVVVPLTLTWR